MTYETAAAQHPYLFFSRADIDGFREKIKTDPDAKARYDAATASAEEHLKEPFVTWEECNGRDSLHANFGRLNQQAGRLCNSLGLKYLIEGDERCAERLKELIERFVSYERWYALSYVNRKPNAWHSDLCSTAATMAMGRIYDMIYDHLTPAERDSLALGIYEKGIRPALGDWALPETRIHALDSMGHNWWAVCISEASCALLAVRDHLPADTVKHMLYHVDRALAEYLTYPGNPLFNKTRSFDDRGMFYESVAYDNYGTGSLLRYLWCSERYFGRNKIIRDALPAGLCDAVMGFSYPRMKDGKLNYAFLNFGDSDFDTDIGLLAECAVKTGIDTSAIRAAASTYGTDIWDEIAGFDYPALNGSVDYLPKTAFYASGFAITRDGWQPDATLFAVKSGFCWNHSHNDAGTFVLCHKGKPFFIDGGTCSYESPLYHAYYCQNEAHSVLLVGNRGSRDEELYRGTKFPGAIIDRYVNGDYVFIQADATGPAAHLCSRMYRNFLWIENRLLVLIDDVFCHEPAAVQLTLHYNGTCDLSDGKVSFTYEDIRARLVSHEPAVMKPEIKHGHPDHKEKEDMPYLSLSDDMIERKHLLIHTLELDPESRDTAFEKLESEDATGLRVVYGDTEREIWYNHRADGHVMHDNSQNTLGGFDTDAYILMITRDRREHTERAFCVNASFLRKNGKVFLSEYAKTTAEITVSI